ncbi:MAG: DUF4054 domain-containing protein [Candidatus Pacearchaeota archaeon]|nr:DUF4054 domain-containing protein [Candidatus Pacearchaeota archaeon]
MITPSELQAKFPGVFDSLSDATIQLAIDEAVLNISESIWGDYYNLGLFYLTAHILVSTTPTALGGLAGAAGSVTSQRAGGVSVSFAAASPGGSAISNFSSTGFGQTYQEYMRKLQCGPLAVEPASAS